MNDDPLADFRQRNRRPLRRLTKFKQALRRNQLRNYPLKAAMRPAGLRSHPDFETSAALSSSARCNKIEQAHGRIERMRGRKRP